MKTASLKEIKTELASVHPARMAELCLKMVKYKKENKELLTYLLFDSYDEKAYIQSVIVEMDEMFKEVNRSNAYHTKKGIRKILGMANKQIKYSGSKLTEVVILIHFCKKLRRSGITLPANSALGNLYWRQVQKIKKALATLHEDLQFDYEEELKLL
ncbi:MAG: hypothetical protein M0Q53_00965 [Prolixibacteraceae bacterium]|jgi:hypothetical protein|nr:hypothetical protein [Prolixibacteraceae bacterium]